MNGPSFLTSSLLVALGGGMGAWLRFVAGKALGSAAFPLATLGVNVSGSLAMGLLAGWLARQGQGAEDARLLLGAGVLGGFTTFSAFSLEAVQLFQRGEAGMAALYVVLSITGGIAGLVIGLSLMGRPA